MKRVAFVLYFVVSTTASGQTPPPIALVQAADSLRKLVESGFAPSIAFSVSNASGPIYEGAFGYADVENRVKATPATAYPVASVAKSLTAIAAMRAADAHIIDLDRPANSYLADDSVRVPIGDASRFTTRNLLHMTAGIPHVVRFHWPDEPRDPQLAKPLGHFAAFAPGTQFYYSNMSLGIVGEVLAHATHKSFSTYMSNAVFRPLGLVSTAVEQSDIPRARLAKAYRTQPVRETGFTRLDPEPGAGMYTSVHDLGTIARKVFLAPDRSFLSDSARLAFIDFSQYPIYSAGWWKDPFRPNGLTVLADGAAFGHAASLKVLPKEGLAVAVAVNGSVPDGSTLGLCDLLLKAAGFRDDPPPAGGAQEIPAEFQDVPVAKDTSWRGNWRGAVHAPSGEIPIQFSFDVNGMRVGLNGSTSEAIKATVSYHVLESSIPGELPRSDVAGVAHTLGIRLTQHARVLTGYVVATAQLNGRPFLMLPFYVSAQRVD